MGEKKRLRLVLPFIRQEFWKCIGCIILAVAYGKKGHTILSEISQTLGNTPPTKLQRDVRGNTDIHKVCCDLYHPYYCYYFH